MHRRNAQLHMYMLGFHFNTQNAISRVTSILKSSTIKDTLKVRISWLIVNRFCFGNMESGVIDHEQSIDNIGSHEDLKKIKSRNRDTNYRNMSLSTMATAQQEQEYVRQPAPDIIHLNSTESKQFKLSTISSSTLKTTINASTEDEFAKSNTIQTQSNKFEDKINSMLPQETSEQSEFTNQNWDSHYASFDSYDYYNQPFSSMFQDESSLLLSPSYNFSGLQVGTWYKQDMCILQRGWRDFLEWKGWPKIELFEDILSILYIQVWVEYAKGFDRVANKDMNKVRIFVLNLLTFIFHRSTASQTPWREYF